MVQTQSATLTHYNRDINKFFSPSGMACIACVVLNLTSSLCSQATTILIMDKFKLILRGTLCHKPPLPTTRHPSSKKSTHTRFNSHLFSCHLPRSLRLSWRGPMSTPCELATPATPARPKFKTKENRLKLPRCD